MGLLNFIKGILENKNHRDERGLIESGATSFKLRQFTFQDKFEMSFDNALIFTGHFIDDSHKKGLGKTLYIPLSEMHSAYTLKITGQSMSIEGVHSFIIRFNSDEERKVVASCDFSGEIFYVEN